jgi:hypothetical protein
MRAVYVISGDVVATVGSDKADTGVGSGLMLGSDGKTIGCDLLIEVQPNRWVPADQLPPGVLSEERRRGTLESGIFYAGKLINRLNVHNIHDRLMAAKAGLELKADEYKGGTTAFRAQIGDPLQRLSQQIEGLQQKLQELRVLDTEAKLAEIEALKARLRRAKRIARTLKHEESKDRIKPEDVEPHPLDYLTDVTRAFSGKTLSTASLEILCRTQRITEYVDENNDLLMNPKKMVALRNMLLQ